MTRDLTAAARPAALDSGCCSRREAAVIGLLLVVVLYANARVPNFAGPLTLPFLVLDAAPILLIALPMTMVIVTGEIDLSVASVVGLSSVLVGVLHHDAGLSIPVAGLVALLVGVVCGAVQRLPRRVRRAAVAGRHDRHPRALPRPRRRAPRHDGGHRLPAEVDEPRPGRLRHRPRPLRPGPDRGAGRRVRGAPALHAASGAASTTSASTPRRRTSPASNVARTKLVSSS